MTYLIQHKKTGEYFQPGNEGHWTLDSSWAEQYTDVAKALLACLRYGLRNVELELRFGHEAGGNYSLQLAVPDTLVLA